MFKTLPCLANDDFLRVSADTGSPTTTFGDKLERFSAISVAYWRFMFACWLTYGYFNIVYNIVNKKMDKKQLFLTSD